MSFDGVPKPGQLTPYATGNMNPYAAANAARLSNTETPLIKKLSRDEKVKAAQREERERHEADDEDERGEAFSEEEAEQIRIMAKMRGIMNLALESGKRYEFQLNVEAGCVDLIEVESGALILQLLPEELMTLSRKIQRYAGMLTDRAG
jgi:uncharacterized FlaG/YvyC family protein